VIENGVLIEASPLELISLWQKRLGEKDELKRLKELLQAKITDLLVHQPFKGSQ